MPIERDRLTVGPIPARFDRAYKTSGRSGDETYQVNVARLECTCPGWQAQRAMFPADDARRVCEHLYDKLNSTKAERAFDRLVQLFICYGRTMYAYRVLLDDHGTFLIGQPFGPNAVRAIGVTNDDKPVLATYNLRENEWSSGESDMDKDLAAHILVMMRMTLPQAFSK
jgi:hypothetical protein